MQSRSSAGLWPPHVVGQQAGYRALRVYMRRAIGGVYTACQTPVAMMLVTRAMSSLSYDCGREGGVAVGR